jgi:hypothetical protein
MSAPTYGWTDFGGMTRKFHYVPPDTDAALCGKWGVSPFVNRSRVRFQPDHGERSVDDCKACSRKAGRA